MKDFFPFFPQAVNQEQNLILILSLLSIFNVDHALVLTHDLRIRDKSDPFLSRTHTHTYTSFHSLTKHTSFFFSFQLSLDQISFLPVPVPITCCSILVYTYACTFFAPYFVFAILFSCFCAKDAKGDGKRTPNLFT